MSQQRSQEKPKQQQQKINPANFMRFIKEYSVRTNRAEQLIIKMDKEFSRYYNVPSEKVLDEKFIEKIDFCFDVYENITSDLKSELPDVGLEFIGDVWDKIILSMKKKLQFLTKSFMLYMTKHRIKEEFDVDNFIKQMRLRQKKEPTIQKGIIDDEFIQFLASKEDEQAKAEKLKRYLQKQLSPTQQFFIQQLKSQLAQIFNQNSNYIKKFFDPLVLEFQESILSIDDILKNKYQFISMQPTKVQEHLQTVLIEIQSKLKIDNGEFAGFSAHEKEVLFYLKYFQSGYMVKQLTDEIQGQITKQTNDKFKKVLRQVIAGNQKAKEEYIIETETQTEQTGVQINTIIKNLKTQIADFQEKEKEYDMNQRVFDEIKTQKIQNEKAKKNIELELMGLKEDYKISQREMNKYKDDANKYATQINVLQAQIKEMPKGGKYVQQEIGKPQSPKQSKDKLQSPKYQKRITTRNFSIQCDLIDLKALLQNEYSQDSQQVSSPKFQQTSSKNSVSQVSQRNESKEKSIQPQEKKSPKPKSTSKLSKQPSISKKNPNQMENNCKKTTEPLKVDKNKSNNSKQQILRQGSKVVTTNNDRKNSKNSLNNMRDTAKQSNHEDENQQENQEICENQENIQDQENQIDQENYIQSQQEQQNQQEENEQENQIYKFENQNNFNTATQSSKSKGSKDYNSSINNTDGFVKVADSLEFENYDNKQENQRNNISQHSSKSYDQDQESQKEQQELISEYHESKGSFNRQFQKQFGSTIQEDPEEEMDVYGDQDQDRNENNIQSSSNNRKSKQTYKNISKNNSQISLKDQSNISSIHIIKDQFENRLRNDRARTTSEMQSDKYMMMRKNKISSAGINVREVDDEVWLFDFSQMKQKIKFISMFCDVVDDNKMYQPENKDQLQQIRLSRKKSLYQIVDRLIDIYSGENSRKIKKLQKVLSEKDSEFMDDEQYLNTKSSIKKNLRTVESEKTLYKKSARDLFVTQKSPEYTKPLQFQTPLTKKRLIDQSVEELLQHEEVERQIELQMSKQIQSQLFDNSMLTFIDASKKQIQNSIKKQSQVYRSQQDLRAQNISQQCLDDKSKKIYVQFPNLSVQQNGGENQIESEYDEQKEDQLITDLYNHMKKTGNNFASIFYLGNPEIFNKFDYDISKMGVDKAPGEFSPEKKLKTMSPPNKRKYPFKSINSFSTDKKADVHIPNPRDITLQFKEQEKMEQNKDDEQDENYLSFDQFKDVYKMVLQIHRNCPNCSHLKSFYQKVGYQQNSNKPKRGIRSQSQNPKLPHVQKNF